MATGQEQAFQRIQTLLGSQDSLSTQTQEKEIPRVAFLKLLHSSTHHLTGPGDTEVPCPQIHTNTETGPPSS